MEGRKKKDRSYYTGQWPCDLQCNIAWFLSEQKIRQTFSDAKRSCLIGFGKKAEEGERGWRGEGEKGERGGGGEGLFCKQLITFGIYPVYISQAV